MNSNNLMPRVWIFWTRNARLAIAILIACMVMLYSPKSTARTISQADSSRVGQVLRLDPKPIRLTEAGARQVLKDKADLVHYLEVLKSQSTLLDEQSQAITAQSQTITKLNEHQQAVANELALAKAQTEKLRKQKRAARLENWGWRLALATYVAFKSGLIGL